MALDYNHGGLGPNLSHSLHLLPKKALGMSLVFLIYLLSKKKSMF